MCRVNIGHLRVTVGHCTQLVFCGVLCGAAAVHTDRPPECCSFVKKTSTESWDRNNIERKMQCCWEERSYILCDRGHQIRFILKCWMEEGSDAKSQALFLPW